MVTYKGLPGPVMCDYWTREATAALYDDGASFQIGRIDMVANTGTYLDSPFHRYADGTDLAGLDLASIAALDGIVIRKPFAGGLAIDAADFAGLDVARQGGAGRDRLGASTGARQPYFENHPFLTAAAARLLVQSGAKLVGIDSHNIDDTRARARPVHSILLGAGIPICEHLTNLGALPDAGFRFSAVPPKIAGMGTFPVRAFAELG